MAEFKSPYNFWAEAINTACHASNRLYLRKGLNKTPYEILTGNKPNLKYFPVFMCKCFILKKAVRLSKFEARAHEGIFVGYATNSHAYRVLNKSTVTWSLMRITTPKWSKVVLVIGLVSDEYLIWSFVQAFAEIEPIGCMTRGVDGSAQKF